MPSNFDTSFLGVNMSTTNPQNLTTPESSGTCEGFFSLELMTHEFLLEIAALFGGNGFLGSGSGSCNEIYMKDTCEAKTWSFGEKTRARGNLSSLICGVVNRISTQPTNSSRFSSNIHKTSSTFRWSVNFLLAGHQCKRFLGMVTWESTPSLMAGTYKNDGFSKVINLLWRGAIFEFHVKKLWEVSLDVLVLKLSLLKPANQLPHTSPTRLEIPPSPCPWKGQPRTSG